MVDLFDDLALAGDGQGKNYEVLKELTKEDNIKLLSELSDNEIKELTRLLFLSNILNRKYRDAKGHFIQIIDLQYFVDIFLKLRVNKDRKRAGEFVNAFTSPRIDQMERNAQRAGMRMIR